MIDFMQWGTVLGFQPRLGRRPELKAGSLRLVAITPEMLLAEQAGDGAMLGTLLRARLTKEWPPVDWEPHVHKMIQKQYDEWPASFGWHRYVALDGGFGRLRTLVGAIGGFPRSNGDVEIGYSTLPAFQRRGYATAAARTLVEWLLTQDGVQSVSAQAYLHVPESIKVMQRCGMSHLGEGDDPGTVRYGKARLLDRSCG
ncbi:MAG: GNAT family N-acetyltransferase [Acidobacteriaceae bacterium]